MTKRVNDSELFEKERKDLLWELKALKNTDFVKENPEYARGYRDALRDLKINVLIEKRELRKKGLHFKPSAKKAK